MDDTQSRKKKDRSVGNMVPEKNTENSLDRVKNEEVFQRMNERKVIWKTIVERRKKWIGNIISNNE